VGREPVPLSQWKNFIRNMKKRQPTIAQRQFSMVHEYPLDGKPMMTSFENKEGKRIIAAKVAQKPL
jgi:Ca2+-transporting ATPase